MSKPIYLTCCFRRPTTEALWADNVNFLCQCGTLWRKIDSELEWSSDEKKWTRYARVK